MTHDLTLEGCCVHGRDQEVGTGGQDYIQFIYQAHLD